MNKKKLQAFYVFIGLLTLVLVNYPIIYHVQNVESVSIPFILIYLLIVALFVSIVGFFLEKRNK